MMSALIRWHIEIEMEFNEGPSRTRASALLRLPDGTELRAHGHANRHPSDEMQIRVGEELAAARTLNDLARQLLERAARDMENHAHSPARPAR